MPKRKQQDQLQKIGSVVYQLSADGRNTFGCGILIFLGLSRKATNHGEILTPAGSKQSSEPLGTMLLVDVNCGTKGIRIAKPQSFT